MTFGTISATYGYSAGIINQAQFSVLVTVVVLSAVVPTAIAQRFFSPDLAQAQQATGTRDAEADADKAGVPARGSPEEDLR